MSDAAAVGVLTELFDGVGIREGFSHHFPHTLFIGYDNKWTLSQRNAAALLFCFGHALALSKQLHGVIINSLVFVFAPQNFT